MKNNALEILKSEGGGPNLETVIGISFGLMVAAALFAFAKAVNNWIKGAQGTVEGFTNETTNVVTE